MPDKIYGEGKPGARPCMWPDEEAPWDFDDPALCRRPATCQLRFKGAQKAIPSCDSCAETMLAECASKKETITKEPLEATT